MERADQPEDLTQRSGTSGRRCTWRRTTAQHERGSLGKYPVPYQACCGCLSGEQVVRPLLRLRPLRWIFRAANGLLAAGWKRRVGAALPLHQPVDSGYRSLVGCDACRVRQRSDGWVLHNERHQLPGLLHCRGTAVLLQLVRQFDLVRELFLPCDGPDVSEPVLPGRGNLRWHHHQWDLGYGVFDYPIILDLLDAAGVTWMVYNTAWDPVPPGDSDNVFVFWKRWANDVRTQGTLANYKNDLKHGRLPQVSFIIPSFLRGEDEHPPADVQVGMEIQQQLVTELQNSSAWDSSAYIITYDESGGYFDHVASPQLDAYGLGFRVPTWVISPFAKPGHLEPTLYEHTSILKFIETIFGLPTLASINHLFDASTPGGTNNQASNGNGVGPPAPPRDARSDIGNLLECFQF